VEDDRLALTGPRQYVPRVDDEDAVAPDDRSVFVDDADAVGVAIESNTDFGVVLSYRRDQVLEVLRNGRIRMVVRERAVALAEQPGSLTAEPRDPGWRDE